KIGKEIVEWQQMIAMNWHVVRFGQVKVVSKDNQLSFDVEVYLNDLNPNFVKVELYSDVKDSQPIKIEMERVRQLAGISGMYVYHITISSEIPAERYTPRVIPNYPGAS